MEASTGSESRVQPAVRGVTVQDRRYRDAAEKDTSTPIVSISKKQEITGAVVRAILTSGNHERNRTLLKRMVRRRRFWCVLGGLFDSPNPAVAGKMCRYTEEFLHCLSETVDKAAAHPLTAGSVRVLDQWLHCMCQCWDSQDENAGCNLTRELDSHWRLSQLQHNGVLLLAEYSLSKGFHGLALFLATMLGADGIELMELAVTSCRFSVCPKVIFELACYAAEGLNNPAAAVVLLKKLPGSIRRSRLSNMGLTTEEFWLTDSASSREAIETLRRENASWWALVCQLKRKNFAEAEETLMLCDSQRCVDYFVKRVAKSSRWDLVSRHVSEACKLDLAKHLLKKALKIPHKIQDATLVPRLFVLAGTDHQLTSGKTYLDEITWSVLPYRPKRALVLARCLVSLGAAAQQRKVEDGHPGTLEILCPLDQAVYYQDLRLIKLLHRSGASSNERLFHVATGDEECYPDSEDENNVVQGAVIKSYLTFAAGCPLRLQDLSRNAVSSNLGGQPGYLQRVQALPVPQLIKEFILFSDLTQEESA